MIIKQLAVVVGTRCNLRCGHCVWTDSERGRDLSRREIENIKNAVARYSPKELLFTGGEPTLYIPLINEIASAHRGRDLKVVLTTNGHFSANLRTAKKTLAAIKKLKHVQLSYDNFHSKYIPLKFVGNLYKACREQNLKFSVLCAIQSPLDLSILRDLSDIGKFNVGVQKVVPRGQARKNGVYFRYSCFDSGVLSKKCPNLGRIAYSGGRGFSVCCSGLVNKRLQLKVAHDSVEKHVRGGFYRQLERYTFGQLLKKHKLSVSLLKPQHSETCRLCEHIFTKAYQAI